MLCKATTAAPLTLFHALYLMQKSEGSLQDGLSGKRHILKIEIQRTERGCASQNHTSGKNQDFAIRKRGFPWSKTPGVYGEG